MWNPADISFRMMFIIGTYLYMLADVDRLDELSDYASRDGSAELVTRMVDFMVGGLTRPDVQPHARKSRPRPPQE